MKTSTIILSIVLLLAIGFVAWRVSLIAAPSVTGNYDNFAKCITEKGAVLYGASWCPHCQEQKHMFGESVQYINYVECADGNAQSEACSTKNIEAYPSWEINGELVVGGLTFDSLSLKTGCELK